MQMKTSEGEHQNNNKPFLFRQGFRKTNVDLIFRNQNSSFMKEQEDSKQQKVTRGSNKELWQVSFLVGFLIKLSSQCSLLYHLPLPAPYSTYNSMSPFPFPQPLPKEPNSYFKNWRCGDGTYANLTSCICLKCDEACSSCHGPTNKDCIECSDGFIWRETSWRGDLRCLPDSCGDIKKGANSQFLDRIEGVCKPCILNNRVVECLGDWVDDAITCKPGYQLHKGRCLRECNPGESKFFDKAFMICRKCHPGCGEGGKCKGPEPSDCSRCGVDGEGKRGLLHLGRCYFGFGTSCPKGQFFDLHERGCLPCSEDCLECEHNPYHCKSCNPRYKLLENRCYEKCPPGTIQESDQCRLTKIKGCIEFQNPNTCLRCEMNQIVSHEKNACLEYSDGSFYVINGRQEFCNDICRTGCLSGHPNGCIDHILYKLTDGTVGLCGGITPTQGREAGTYFDHLKKTCEKCHPKCKTCFWDNEFSCLSCKEGTELYNDGSCGPLCPDGHFGESMHSGCSKCHPECSECSGNDVYSCTACKRGFKLVQGRCQKICLGDGVFKHQNDLGCTPCHSSCRTCLPDKGYLNGYCLECQPGYLEHLVVEEFDGEKEVYFNPERKFCYKIPDFGLFYREYSPRQLNRINGLNKECGDGYFKFNSTSCVNFKIKFCNFAESKVMCKKCQVGLVVDQNGGCSKYCSGPVNPIQTHISCYQNPACPDNCNSCSRNELRSCLSCQSGFTLFPDYTCRAGTPPGYFIQGRVSKCQKSCRTCINQEEDGCTSCQNQPFFALMRNGIGNSKTEFHEFGRCVKKCPEGFSKSKLSICEKCHSTCLRCSKFLKDHDTTDPDTNPANGCTRCYLGQSLRRDNSCGLCASGTYTNSEQRCIPCHSSCQECFSKTENSCLACRESSLLIMDTKTCLAADQCPPLYFKVMNSNSCFRCHKDCKSCSGPTDRDCLSCFLGKLLNIDGTCAVSCKLGSFEFSDSECKACPKNCLICLKSSSQVCLECKRGTLMLEDTTECVFVCPKYYFELDSTTCGKCHPRCYHCSGRASDQCSKCDRGVLFDPNKRNCECPTSSFYRNHRCEKCYLTCLSCKNETPNGCLSCRSGLYLTQKGECTSDCGSGHWVDGQARCRKCHPTCKECDGDHMFHCLECPSLFHVVTTRGSCIDCRDSQKRAEAFRECFFLVGIKVELNPDKEFVDPYSSKTVQIEIDYSSNFLGFLSRLTLERINEFLSVKLVSAARNQTHRFRLHSYTSGISKQSVQAMLIDFNCSEARLTSFSYKLIVEDPHWSVPSRDLINEKLSIEDKELLFTFNMKIQDLDYGIDRGKQLGNSMNLVGSAMGTIAFIGTITSVLSSDGSGVFLKLMRLIKIVVRLINVDFGIVINEFFKSLNDYNQMMTAKFSDLDRIYFSRTRGKLTKEKITIFANKILWYKVILYFFIKAAKIIARRIKSTTKNANSLSKPHLYFVLIIDNLNNTLFFVLIYDAIFFCGHEILHHDNSIPSKSYIVRTGLQYSYLTLTLIMTDVLSYFSKLQQIDHKLMKRAIAEQNASKNFEQEHKDNILAKYRMEQKYKKATMSMYYNITSEMGLLLDGLKIDKFDLWAAKYYRFIGVVRFLTFDILIISLQLLPKVQIIGMFSVQAAFLTFSIIALFVKKVYMSSISGLIDLLTETVLTIFLFIGLVDIFPDQVDEKKNGGSETMVYLQVMVIWLIVLTCVVNIFQAIVLTILKFVNLWKFLVKKVQEPRKTSKVNQAKLAQRLRLRQILNWARRKRLERKRMEELKRLAEERENQLARERILKELEDRVHVDENEFNRVDPSNVSDYTRQWFIEMKIKSMIQMKKNKQKRKKEKENKLRKDDDRFNSSLPTVQHPSYII